MKITQILFSILLLVCIPASAFAEKPPCTVRVVTYGSFGPSEFAETMNLRKIKHLLNSIHCTVVKNENAKYTINYGVGGSLEAIPHNPWQEFITSWEGSYQMYGKLLDANNQKLTEYNKWYPKAYGGNHYAKQMIAKLVNKISQTERSE